MPASSSQGTARPRGMRPTWKGAVSFGLVTIPVRLYRATETRDVRFHQVRASDGSRVHYTRLADDGEEVAFADLAKGFELPGGELVILTDDELADLPLTSSRAIEVESFVPLEQVDPIYFDKTYYVEPEGANALKPYALLRTALADSGRVALVKVALRSREQLATLRVQDKLFVLETMIWPDEVREPDFAFLDQDVEVRSQELAMASSLIKSLAADFDPGQYTDSYREAVQALVDAKVAGHQVVAPREDDGPRAEVVDLMTALRQSVAAAKRGREPAGQQTQPAPEPPAPQAPAKPAPATKAAAKKAPAKKAPGRKAPAKKAPAKKAATAETESEPGRRSGTG